MRSPFRRSVPVLATCLALAPAVLRADRAPAVADVLKVAGEYLAQYPDRVAAVAAEELFIQSDTSSGQMGTPKRVSADVVLYGAANGAIVAFRDVFAVDNQPVRQRDDRLPALFKSPTQEKGEQAQRLNEESVRHYLSPNLHALDQPAAALEFLRKDNQERSTFKVEGVKTQNGAQIATLKFTERSIPHLLDIGEEAAAMGRFWVDVANGTVRQTELGLTGRQASLRITVKYAEQAPLALWLPSEMYQQFDFTGYGSTSSNSMGAGGGYNGHQALEGRATYSKYRVVEAGSGK